ncbi:Trafficking protein particle complex subunit 31 [Ordospora colligata]
MVEYFMENADDTEERLKEIGYEVGIRMLEVYRFEREVHIPTLLYRVAFDLLPHVNNSDRRIEKSNTTDGTYIIMDMDGIFSRFMSVPQSWDAFCADSVVCGLLEAAFTASGHQADVVVFPRPTEKYPNRVVFQISCLK